MAAYYNENDPRAAAWLRELMRAGEIPEGEIDTRSITDIRPHELLGFTQQHFFAGIGGWALALRLAGWPDSRPVRTGSCPCQPFSNAGKRKGVRDSRHLWPVWRSLIADSAPAVTFGEQVASKAGRLWLARVRADLEALGYAVGAADLCAAGVGAPHIRQRLFWVADPGSERSGRDSGAVSCPQAQSDSQRVQLRSFANEPLNGGSTERLADRDCERFEGGAEPHVHPQQSALATPRRPYALRCGDVGGLAHPALSEGARLGSLGEQLHRPTAWSAFAVVHCTDGKARRFEPGSFPLAHGVPGRVGLLRGYGNAIVPQIAAEFVTAFLEATES